MMLVAEKAVDVASIMTFEMTNVDAITVSHLSTRHQNVISGMVDLSNKRPVQVKRVNDRSI